MTSRKKLILNLDSNEHIITETKIDKPDTVTLNNVDIINVDTSTLNKKKVNNNLSNSNLDTLYKIDSQLINSNSKNVHINNAKNLDNRQVSNTIVHNNNNTQDTDKLNKYLEQKLDIERKINKLNKRIKDPKYGSKKSLYISDLDKCNIKLQKLEKNINIYKLHNKHPNNNFNTNYINNTNYSNNINKSKMSKSGLMQTPALDINYLTKQNINSNIPTIENELNKLESDLKLTESVIPLLKSNTSTHLTNIPSSTNVNNPRKLNNNNAISINNVNVNNMQTMQTIQNKQVLDASKLNKLKVKKEASLSAPVSINSQLKTLKEKETFYKEQQRRIQEKFKLEMQKINKLKQQQQEIQKLKEIDKQKKKTFILEQKLKKIERYKFLINKLTNLECIYTVNNDNNASKNLINKDKSINKVYQPYTHTNNVKIINPNTIRHQRNIHNTLNNNLHDPSITTTPITSANNSYFNKFINYVNTLGFMGVGESIPLTLSHSMNLNTGYDILAKPNKGDKLNTNNINSNIDVLYSINSNYALLDYKCKYLSDPIKYYDYVDTLWNDLNIKDAMISVLLNCNKYNECNKLLLGQDNIIYDKIDVDTLNDMIKKNDYNISRCYFNKYSNNFKLQQFKDNCNYMAFNYENVLDNTLFKNKFVSYSQLDKYKLIDFINQYYQYMDKSFIINLIV